MFIPEVIGKFILKKHGFLVPNGILTGTVKEVSQKSSQLSLPLLLYPYQPYLSCQHHAIRYKASSHTETTELCRYLFQKSSGEEVVTRIYLEEDMKSTLPFRITIGFDVAGYPIITVKGIGKEGGSVKWKANYLQPFSLEDAVELWEMTSSGEEFIPALSIFTVRCYQLFLSLRLERLEMNEIAYTGQEIAVKEAKLYLDAQDQGIEKLMTTELPDTPIQLPRPIQTTLEKEVAEINHRERTRGWCRYMELPEQESGVAVCFAGTGLSLTMADFLAQQGVIPVNLTDISSGISERKLVILLRSILSRPRVKSLIMVINFFQFTRVDVYASALVTVLKELAIDPNRFPILVRLAGPGSRGAQEILRSHPGIRYFTEDIPFHEIRDLVIPLMAGYERKEAL